MTAKLSDPILVEVARHKLEGIVEEMQTSLVRSSYSPIVKEAQDASCCLFRPDGTVVAQSRSNPSHLGSLVAMMESVLETYPAAEMRDGDIYIFNDPYLGGTHLPDIGVFAPVLVGGHTVALTASMAHHIDIGGMQPGSIPTNATDIFQEGLRIPPMQLVRQGKMDQALLALIRRNVRMPDTLEGDLNAQISACRIAARRLKEFGETHGVDGIADIFEMLISRSERMTREALAALPQGTFVYEDYLDNDGIELDQRITIKVSVTIEDGQITFDFTGTSPQVKGPLNIVPCGVRSSAYYGVRALTGSHIPTNGGCFRLVKLVLPEGTVVNPREPAPVNGRTAVMKRIASCTVGALAQAVPEKFPAASAASVLVMALAGQTEDGRRFVQGELVNGGSGAAQGADGVDAIATDMTNGRGIPAEAIELEAPIRVRQSALRPDSGGAGTWRGGLGVIREYEILAGPVGLSHRGERHYSQAAGLMDGGPGASAHSEIRRADGSVEVIPSKCATMLQTGDRVWVETAGGGGYGDPAKRDPDAADDDRIGGKVG
ncbi:MAG: hydantoinase B/oxoprolinase family protein [Pseudomonadota bacterium]